MENTTEAERRGEALPNKGLVGQQGRLKSLGERGGEGRGAREPE